MIQIFGIFGEAFPVSDRPRSGCFWLTCVWVFRLWLMCGSIWRAGNQNSRNWLYPNAKLLQKHNDWYYASKFGITWIRFRGFYIFSRHWSDEVVGYEKAHYAGGVVLIWPDKSFASAPNRLVARARRGRPQPEPQAESLGLARSQ